MLQTISLESTENKAFARKMSLNKLLNICELFYLFLE